MRKNNLQMVIPCGGLATRLGDLAKDIPKSLMEIHGKPFLEYQIELIKRYNFDELVLCIGHLGEQIKDYFGDGSKFGISIKYSKDNGLGVIGAIKNAEPLLLDTFILMYGDSYLPSINFHDMYENFINQDRLALMSVWKNNNRIDKSNVKVENGEVVSVDEPDSKHIDYGAIVLNKKSLEYVPKNQPFSTAEFWKALSKHHQISSYEVTERYYDIGSAERLDEVRNIIGESLCLKQ